MRRKLLLFALLATAVASAATPEAPRGEVRVDTLAACGLAAGDQHARVQQALERAAGGTLVVPAGCRLVIGPPPPGAAALTVPTGTRVRCESHTAGFFLARRACAGGRYEGAACRSDTDCLGGGTCRADAPSGAFAGASAGRPATLLAAAAGSGDVRLSGCSIWVNGQDDYGRCAGGTREGRPCRHRCARKPEIACDEDADCPAGAGSCENLSDCRTAVPSHGTCSGEPGLPVGAGDVNPVDLSAATDAVVEDVWIYDHRRGAHSFAIGAGAHAVLRESDNTKSAHVHPGAFGWAPLIRPSFHVEAAAAMGAGATAARNVLRGLGYGIRATGGNATIERNEVSATAATSYGIHAAGGNLAITGNRASAATYVVYAADHSNTIERNLLSGTGERTVGIWLAGSQQSVTGNQVGAYTCIQGNPVDTPAAPAAANVSFVANRCIGGAGPKVVIQGPGWLVANNYLAWGTTGPAPVVAIGGAGARAAAAGHAMIVGNMLHTDQPGGALVGFADPGRRCDGGPRAGEPCAGGEPAECPAARCRSQDYGSILVANNAFLKGSVGIDLAPLTSGSTVDGLDVSGNQFTALLQTGIRFPATAAHVRGVHVSGNHFAGVAAPLTGWSWTMGQLDGNGPLTAADDSVEVVRLKNGAGGRATAGDAVEVHDGADGAFRVATAGSTRFLGIVLDAPAAGAVGTIAIRGVTTCNVTDGTIRRGDRLAMSATPGKLAAADRGDPAVALALAEHPAGGGGAVRCLVAPVAPAASRWSWFR